METTAPLELTEVLRAVTILSPQAFVFAGQVVNVVPGALGTLPALYSQQDPLLTQLLFYLYQFCYCTRFDTMLEQLPPTPGMDERFVQELSAANASQERWDAGWIIDSALPGGQLLVRKDSLARTVWPGEFLAPQTFGRTPGPGATISVYVPRESLTMQPGFYFAFGEAVADVQDDMSILRFYWNLRDTGAAILLQGLTTRLNRFQVPFRFKCLTTRAHYRRRDAAVLFVGKRFYHIVAELVGGVRNEVAGYLDADTPLFTKRLAPGLGLAEDPGNMVESFGMSRCRILAEGLWKAYQQGAQTEQDRLQIVTQQFVGYGLRLEQPYLNAGSVDRYAFPLQEESRA
jgi:hypothetical protein